MAASRLELLQGTLDLMVLQTLEAMGALHGHEIARRIEQLSEDHFVRPGRAWSHSFSSRNWTRNLMTN